MLPVSDIVKAANALYELAKKSKVNDKQAEVLAERTKKLLELIVKIPNLDNTPSAQGFLENLQKTIAEASTLVKSFGEDGWLLRFAKANRYKEEITAINDRLHQSEQDILLGFTVDDAEHEAKRAQIDKAHREWLDKTLKASKTDMTALQIGLGKLVDLNEHQLDTIEKLERNIATLPKLIAETLAIKTSDQGSELTFKGKAKFDSIEVTTAVNMFHYKYPEGASEEDKAWLDSRAEKDKHWTSELLAQGIRARHITSVVDDREVSGGKLKLSQAEAAVITHEVTQRQQGASSGAAAAAGQGIFKPKQPQSSAIDTGASSDDDLKKNTSAEKRPPQNQESSEKPQERVFNV